jgi:hypothetical protein
MFSIFDRQPTSHVVFLGSVGCPVEHRDVDIEGCLRCERLRDVKIDDGMTVVRCNTAPPAADLAFA